MYIHNRDGLFAWLPRYAYPYPCDHLTRPTLLISLTLTQDLGSVCDTWDV